MPTSAFADRDVRFGTGAIELVGAVADGLGARRVLLVRGRRSFTASGGDRLLPGLEAVAEVEQWSDFAPNTDAADLAVGLGIVERFDPDLVVAVGGGSAMDMAKLLCAFRGVTDADELQDRIRAGAKVTGRATRLVLAPTTSGSGSEATRFAVVYIGNGKFSIEGPAMLPDAVVLDPSLTVSGSAYQRATSGVDAVAQAIESLWAVGATEESRVFAREALELLLGALEGFAREPDEANARAMALGAHLAGRAIDVSRTTAAHALSYGITKTYGLSHGHAVGVTLGAFIEAHADPSRLREGIDPAAHAAAMAAVLGGLGAADGTEARERFTALMQRLGLETSLGKAGADTPASREALAASVNVQRLGNNPVDFSAPELAALLQGID
ncbi:phosphonoacetaldehyde reductase [Glycomyces paridis]|uniref:Phosphonoacetaldehyde reductase n=1 Tax=Glycomyces paridis TaxID=2126555 RepID=A0A4S8PQN9_9ACTN|nr:phosphonoacetaldehyde reductase [Glycomyces paridis]THV31972.1 phosphonoacetaldehyde reductase [Glycomyces paridis]